MAGCGGGGEPLLRAQGQEPPHEVFGGRVHAIPVRVVESVPVVFSRRARLLY